MNRLQRTDMQRDIRVASLHHDRNVSTSLGTNLQGRECYPGDSQTIGRINYFIQGN